MSSSLPINNFRPLQREQPTQNAVEKKLKEVSELYEKQFLRMMMKEMRATVKPSGLNQPSMTEKIFSEKLDNEYVEKWGAKGGIGLADIIFSQLKEKFSPGSMQQRMRPQGPVPLQKGSTIRIDQTGDGAADFKKLDSTKSPDMSFHVRPAEGDASARQVQAPWSGQVSKAIESEDLNLIEIQHDQGLKSRLAYKGDLNSFKVGDQLEAGQNLGLVSADEPDLNWQLVEVGA